MIENPGRSNTYRTISHQILQSSFEAAKILGVGEHRVRQMLRDGELEGERDETLDRWKIPKRGPRPQGQPRGTRPQRRSPQSPESPTDLLVIVRDLENQLGYMRARAELTERAESTLREDLERERPRADEERRRADRLEAELQQERSKVFWARLFG